MIFRAVCAGCGGGARARRPACDSCLGRMAEASLAGLHDPPPGIDRADALYRYEPAVRALVLAAKNGGHRRLYDLWGRALAARLAGRSGEIDVVTWVPASRQGARVRGFDQGRLLARSLAREAGLDCLRLVVRRPGVAQTGRDRASRLDGPALRVPVAVPPRVLLIDDVWTTGASLAAGADALRRAGAASVDAVVVAAVGDHRASRRATDAEPVLQGADWSRIH